MILKESCYGTLNSDPQSTLLPASGCVFHPPLLTWTQTESTTVSTAHVHSTSVDHLEFSDHVFSSDMFSRPTISQGDESISDGTVPPHQDDSETHQQSGFLSHTMDYVTLRQDKFFGCYQFVFQDLV